MLTDKQKKEMIKLRLLEYQRRMFEHEMNLVAAKANGDKTTEEISKRNIEQLQKAYDAVKVMI